jgi:hypothetical protein
LLTGRTPNCVDQLGGQLPDAGWSALQQALGQGQSVTAGTFGTIANPGHVYAVLSVSDTTIRPVVGPILHIQTVTVYDPFGYEETMFWGEFRKMMYEIERS